MEERPEGIIITIGAKILGDHGYRHWLRNFLEAMKRSETDDDWYYWLRQGNQPKADSSLQFVYLCIGGKIRYRCYYAGSKGAGAKLFEGRDREIFGKAWVLIAGPVERAPFKIERKGFQGFRYCQKLF